MKPEAKAVTIKLIQAGTLFALACCTPFLAYSGVFMPADESLSIWFQRSGSLVTMLAVIAEITMFKIPEIIYSDGNASKYPPFDDDTLQEKFYIFFKYLGFVLIIIGTLIWGYGDIPVQKIT